MRTIQDRIQIKVDFTTTADLDMERIEQDPTWESILFVSSSLEDALIRYVLNYLSRQNVLLFTNMPSTNGPADINVTNMEILKHDTT